MQPVAVKVKHPGVEQRLRADFAVMLALARAAATLPVLRDLRFDDSCAQFGLPLHQQLDLSLEARNLDRFRSNFRCGHTSACRCTHACAHATGAPRQPHPSDSIAAAATDVNRGRRGQLRRRPIQTVGRLA